MRVRVFLVEDTPHLQDAIRGLLEGLGSFPVVGTATTEAEANLWLLDNPGAWDLAIIDLILEQGTGMGVIAKCRESSASGQILVFSDYATPAIERHCLGLGAAAVIHKSDLAGFSAYCRKLGAA